MIYASYGIEMVFLRRICLKQVDQDDKLFKEKFMELLFNTISLYDNLIIHKDRKRNDKINKNHIYFDQEFQTETGYDQNELNNYFTELFKNIFHIVCINSNNNSNINSVYINFKINFYY